MDNYLILLPGSPFRIQTEGMAFERQEKDEGPALTLANASLAPFAPAERKTR